MNFERVLENRVAIVTGGAGGDAGLGLTATEALSRAGAQVTVWDINPQAIDNARAELESLGVKASFEQVDVTDTEQLAAAHRSVHERFGIVDILVNSAALKMDYMLGVRHSNGSVPVPFWELESNRFRKVVEVNIVGTFLVASLIAPEMVKQGRGSIINISTSSRTIISPKHIPYGPSKAAIEAMTLSMATQMKDTGVRANALLPGGSANRRGKFDPAKSPYDCMAGPLVWLASDESVNVTGKVYVGTDFPRIADWLSTSSA